MEMVKWMLTLSPFPSRMTFAFELTFGHSCKDLFLRQYCFDTKLLVAPLSTSILQSVPSSKVPTVVH